MAAGCHIVDGVADLALLVDVDLGVQEAGLEARVLFILPDVQQGEVRSTEGKVEGTLVLKGKSS